MAKNKDNTAEEDAELEKLLAEDAETIKAEEDAELEKLLAEDAETIKAEVAKKGKYFVVKGKSLTTKIGVVSGDIELKAKHLTGGQKSLDGLIAAKIVKKF